MWIYWEVIMPKNTFLIPFKLLWFKMVFFTNLLALIHPLRMELLKKKNRHLETAEHSYFKWKLLNIFGLMQFPQPTFWLIACLPLFYKVRFPIVFSCLLNSCFLLSPEYLIVLVLFVMLDRKSLKCVFLGYSRLQKGYQCYCPTLNRYLVSTDVTLLDNIHFFPASSTYPS